jgi:hypothetical protein
MFQSFADTWARGVSFGLDFDHGLMRHHLLAKINESAESGSRTRFDPPGASGVEARRNGAFKST